MCLCSELKLIKWLLIPIIFLGMKIMQLSAFCLNRKWHVEITYYVRILVGFQLVKMPWIILSVVVFLPIILIWLLLNGLPIMVSVLWDLVLSLHHFLASVAAKQVLMIFLKIIFIKFLFMSIFNKIKLSRPKRTVHNMSYSSQFSLPFGRLVPIMCEKVVPGDKFVHGHEFLLRFAPFTSQVFQSFQTRVDYFFVPSRLVWTNFEKFLVDDANEFVHPYIDLARLYDGSTNFTGSLFDYFNLPTVNPTAVSPYYEPIDLSKLDSYPVDCLPFFAYLKIFLDYYADENLLLYSSGGTVLDYQAIVEAFESFIANNGDQTTDLTALFRIINNNDDLDTPLNQIFAPLHRAYPKDYFTSALPFAQRGPIVQIPLNGSGDVLIQGPAPGNQNFRYTGLGVEYQPGEGGDSQPGEIVDVKLFPPGQMARLSRAAGVNPATGLQYEDGLEVATQVPGSTTATIDQLIQASSRANALSFKAVNVNGTATINDLRTAIAVQSWLEKNARAGVRYKEQLASHFGVRSRDYRLDRAELLQSSKSTVSIGEVFTTAQNDDGTFMPGLGVSTATGSSAIKPFKHYFEEHGYVIGLMTVYPKAAYYQGVPRQFTELDKFDYYWPEFQHIGEQDIKSHELYLDSSENVTFGYTPRYAHYKSRTNQIHGDFRTALINMHDGRALQSHPNLNMDFINIDVETNNLYRVFNAVGEYADSYPVFCDFFHNFKAIRPMSYFGIPRII